MTFVSTPPLGLYIHLPWCTQKCPYCDFNSYQADSFDENAYVSNLIDDLQADLPLVWGRQITSIFIGGGTPSLFSGDAIHQLLSDLRACLNLNPAIEITLEANPGSADAGHFTAYRQAGINRLSLGVQSFDDELLTRIGRIHNGEQANNAYFAARQAGFDNINLDLMYALPGQTLAQANRDVERAIALAPEHVSHYQLTVEPNTRFHHQPPSGLPDDELSWQMQTDCQQLLAHNGYAQYEISAYAKPRMQCRHNLNYWHFGDYLGIGAGAHGKITLPAENRVIRTLRARQPQGWMNALKTSTPSRHDTLIEQDLVFEFMLNALRLTEGFDRGLFVEHSGLADRVLDAAMHKAVELGLLDVSDSWVKPTALGLQFHNDLQALFLDVDISTLSQVEPVNNFPSGR